MSWYLQWSDSIKKRACRYLLQRYLGQFLEEKLTLDQLTVDLYNGTGSVSDVILDVQALNELGEQVNLPIEFVDGYISEMSVSVPWAALFTDSCFVEVTGMQLTIQPKQRSDDAGSMLESMWSSMTSSMQLAAECLQQEVSANEGKESENDQSMEGLELIAHAIESILTRVKIKFVNTIIRLEHLPKESNNGIAIEVRIKKIDYCDEASSEMGVSEGEVQANYQISAFSIKKFHCDGITFYSDEFPAERRTFSRSIIVENRSNDFSGPKNEKPEQQPILIGKLAGRQEIRLKLKQGEAIQGAKVDLELNLGSLTMFLSPRQLHLLLELMHGLAAPHTQDTSNVLPRNHCSQKPMNSGDYEKVEQELQDALHSPTLPQVMPKSMPRHGWSSASLGDESDDDFLPMKGIRGLSESVLSDASMDTSITSTNTSTTFNSKSQDSGTSGDYYSSPSHSSSFGKKRKGRRSSSNVDSEISGEVISFNVRLASLAVVLLHEDILTLGVDTWALTQPSVTTMCTLSEKFFHHLGFFGITGYGNKDFEAAKQVFLNACEHNHIRLLAAAVMVEGCESGNSYNSIFSAVLSAASFEILECLVENDSYSKGEAQYVELLKFMKSGGESSPEPHFSLSSEADVRLHLKQTRRARHTHRNTTIHTEVTFTLQQCWSELDLSIIDRITAIINPQPLCQPQTILKETMTHQSQAFSQAVENASLPDSKLDFKLMSDFIVLKFRFPIPDLRPVHDVERYPWWQRSVRKDVLYFHFIQTTLHTERDNRSQAQGYQLHANEIITLFQEGETDKAVPFARATGCEKNDSSIPKVGQCSMPQITLRIYPKFVLGELEEIIEKEDNGGLSQSCFIDTSQNQPSPFMSKRVVHESDTSHRTESEGEELIIPGDKQEMTEFINQAVRDARVQVEICIPNLMVHFQTKHLYEVIYNRINSDLSLWQSSAPKSNPDYTSFPTVDLNMFQESLFCFCKSGLQYDSDSDSNEDSSGFYYSAYDQKHKQTTLPQQPGQSRFALNMSVNHGVLNFHTNLRDGSGNIVPEQYGEIQINLDEASIFSISHYKGIPQHNYICLQVNNVAMHHKDVIGELIPDRPSPLYSFGPPPTHLEPTIYRSERGICVKPVLAVGRGSSCSKDMLTAAISTQVNENRVKTIRIACGLRGATLRHRVTLPQHSWLTQLIDFFDVIDYPVRGYDSPQVITELHQHLWDCAIDYRPTNLPLRCVLTLGSLSVSSNMAARTKTSTLRFIAEEASLLISDRICNSRDPVDLQMDYISVIELGLFELSLRLSDQINSPKVDLRASNNVLNIRTCSDSAHALAQLITYFASDGDLMKSESKVKKKEEPLVQTTPENETSDVNLTESTVERVNVMMEDAMKDVNALENKRNKRTNQEGEGGVEVFFFPDEGCTAQQEVVSPVDWAGSDLDSEHDFCMLEHETGSGIMPQSGLPEVRVLTAMPIHIIENHFSVALGKADMLCPPKHYPTPVYRYTLRDMTLVWHMYGGHDFSGKLSNKKHVVINESSSAPTSPAFKKYDTGKDWDDFGVSFSKVNPKEVNIGNISGNNNKKERKTHKKFEETTNWQLRGGSERDHNVLMQLQLNKVRFQHEVYPEKTVQASRQVLLVHELEVRDRLATSRINKFLYQYSSEASPRQSHANMVVIKAVHLRPDPRRNIQETCLKVSLLPLRLNIDQDSLLFLINFINQLSGVQENSKDDPVNVLSSQLHQAPVMSVDVEKNDDSSRINQSTLLILLEDDKKIINESDQNTVPTEKTPVSPIFVRSFVFSPEVPIRIDYEGKRVDMSHGPLAGLLMGLGQLSCLQLKLKRLSHRHGLLGFDKLVSFVISEWIQDIKKTQLPNLIGGVGPMHSLVQLFQGIRDLFWLPIEQYQKDGRIVRGLQRGANSFTTSTAMAALELTARIVQAIQSVAETAFDMLSPGPSVRRLRGKKGKHSHRFSQPADIREGVANAYTLVKEGLGETAETLVRVASAEAEQKGAVGAVGGVLRQIPPTVVAPIILASAATSNLLGGVRSQLAPDVRREATLKWRTDDT